MNKTYKAILPTLLLSSMACSEEPERCDRRDDGSCPSQCRPVLTVSAQSLGVETKCDTPPGIVLGCLPRTQPSEGRPLVAGLCALLRQPRRTVCLSGPDASWYYDHPELFCSESDCIDEESCP